MPVLSRRLFLVVAVVMALLASCSDLNSPVKEYLEEYSSSAAVGYQQILVPSEKDADGIDSIASNADGVIRFLLRNPRTYDISSNITLDDETIPLTIGTDYHLNLSADRQSISLTFTDEFLRAHDGETSGNLSATLTMSDAYRTFPSWHFNLRSNTPPPAPYASRVMLEPSDDLYVLCFNLDLGNEVQDDIASVTVNGNVFTVAGVTAGGTQAITFAPADPRMSTTPPVGLLRPVGDLQPFAVEDGMTQVYFRTGIEASSLVESRFTITVRDACGLSRSAITTTKGEMLVQPVIRNRNNETPVSGALSLYPEADGTYQVVLDHTVTGTTLHWSIDGGATQSSSSLPCYLTIPADCTLMVWASKSGFVNSDPVTVNLRCVTNIYYVDPSNPNAADATDHGSQSRPFRTITYAMNRFDDPEDTGNTVYLMGDITGREFPSNNGCVAITPPGNLSCTIEGLGTNRTITDDNTDLCRGIYLYTLNTAHITLRNLTITGCYDSSAGGGIYFNAVNPGSSLTLEDCIVSNNQVNSTSSAVQGGGIYFQGSVLTIRGSEIRQNSISTNAYLSKGGGLYARGTGSTASIEIFSSTFFENGCRSNYSGSGGGLYVDSAVLLLSGTPTDNTYISNNYANADNGPSATGHGGGILLVNGSGTMQANVIISNNASTIYPPMGTGGGIRIETTNTPRSFTMNGGQILENWAGKFADSTPSYGGGIYAAGNGSASLTLNLNGGTITGNYATGYANSGTSGIGFGGGVHATNNVAIFLRGTTITDNKASRDGTGYGGGICIQPSLALISTFTMTGGEISLNTSSVFASGLGGGVYIQPYSTTSTPTPISLSGGSIYANKGSQIGTGSGGGLYLAGYISATMSSSGPSPLNIENNTASILGEGNGGGIYVKGQTALRPLTLTMSGGNISGNTASADNNGQGGAFFIGENAKVTSDSSTVNVSNNTASQSTNTSYGGYGGAFYLSGNSLVTWNAGTMNGNQGKSNTTSGSLGEAINISGSATEPANFVLSSALGDNTGPSGNAIRFDDGSTLTLYANASLPTNNYIRRDNGGTIVCKEYLYTNNIQLREIGIGDNETVVSECSRENYYKFIIADENLDNLFHCINAEGKYNEVYELSVNDFTQFVSVLGGSLNPNVTHQFKFDFSSSSAMTATIPEGIHVRIIPQNPITISPSTVSLFVVNGHLLVGNPALTTSIICSGSVPTRSAPLILMQYSSSLVLRNVDVRNSYAETTTPASLIDAGAVVPKTIVLDDFTYDQSEISTLSGYTSALDLSNNTVCHFVSGSIRHFRSNYAAGVAFIGASSHLYLHPGPPGISFLNNSRQYGSSIEGSGYPGNLHNLGGYPTPPQ